MRITLALVFFSCCACQSLHKRTVGPVTVLANSTVLADRAAAGVEATLPHFSVPHSEPKSLTLRVGADGAISGTARKHEAEIRVDPRVVAAGNPYEAELTLVVVHELQHLYIPAAEREILPALVEEGVVDARALELVPAVRGVRRAERALRLLSGLGREWVSFSVTELADGKPHPIRRAYVAGVTRLPPVEEAFAIDRRTLHDLPDTEAQLLASLGWLLVDRAGLTAVESLVERAKREHVSTLPAAWMFAAARLDPDDPESWVPVITALIGEDEQRAIDTWQADSPLFLLDS